MKTLEKEKAQSDATANGLKAKVDELEVQLKSSKDKQERKLKKYKKYIHMLKNDLQLLERSHQVSVKALKHTENFVDEVVYVNDKLVHSLSKTKTKLRSFSGSSRGSRRDAQSRIF